MKRTITDKWYFVIDKNKDIANYKLKDILKHRKTKVTIPHTFNNLDGQDGGGDYFRSTVYYYIEVKKLKFNSDYSIHYLEFEGVNSICDVYFDDIKVQHHEGGFQTFRVDCTNYLNAKYLIVKVDNSKNDYVYPQFADFTFFGGIYRNVNVIEVNPPHFDLDYYGSNGVKVDSTVDLENNIGTINCECFIKQYNDAQLYVTLETRNEEFKKEYTLSDTLFTITIDNPLLWSCEAPNIYKLSIHIIKNNIIHDYVIVNVAFRKYEIKEDGFYLNGKSYPLRGVSRHQDRLNKGWAISVNDQIEDITLIKQMGANSVRLAHYQHSNLFYTLCDLHGLIVWAEVPYISSNLANGEINILNQMKELVIQTYNNPSVIILGLSNEITIASGDSNLEEIHNKLNDIVKKYAPHKLTTIAQVSMEPIDSKLNKVPDLISYNHYFGWYGGSYTDYEPWYQDIDRVCGLSEYGAECNINYHSKNPKQADYSEEYQLMYHASVLSQLYHNPKVWCMYVWNMFDFASDNRQEGGTKGRNNKGLVTYDRKIKKDSFYIYKAYMSKESFIHIASKRFKFRDTHEIDVTVISNIKDLDIYVNNKFYKKIECNKLTTFKVKLDKMVDITVASTNLEYSDSHRFIYNPKKAMKYTLDNKDEVVNWFNDSTFKIDDNYFSIKDKLKDIMQNDRGKEYIDSLFEKMGKDANIPSGILKIVNGFTIERISQMAKSHFPKEVVIEINNELQKIKK